ncbi:MAG: hypothetical protein IJM64_04540 [Ottowia sp.]|nr:hypothetical protein [Ottowia sp.]
MNATAPSLLVPPEGWAEADFVQAVLARLPWHHQEALPEATMKKHLIVQTVAAGAAFMQRCLRGYHMVAGNISRQ